jgi:hypothetical protein
MMKQTHLDVWSERDSDREVELSVPSSVAYTTSPAPRRPWLSGKETEIKSRVRILARFSWSMIIPSCAKGSLGSSLTNLTRV